MRNILNLFLILLITSQITPALADTIPQKLSITVQGEGVTRLDYIFQGEITRLQTNITLLGETFIDLFIFNEDGLPLEYDENENWLTVYSLGSSLVNVTYLTAELTGKTSIIWSLNTTVPISTEIILPIGATIISLNTIPLEINSLDGRTILVMPAGPVDIKYTVDILDSEVLADEAINLAEIMIHDAENIGAIVTSAKTLLSEAKTLFLQSSFLASEEIANQAIEVVEETLENMMLAEAKITAAKTAIQVAQDSGNTIGLDDAESFLMDAETKFEEGDYEKALIHADEAFEAALNSEKPENNTYYYIAILAVILLVGAFWVIRRRSIIVRPQIKIEIDLERLFHEHPELRMDDREVLKYLAENDGEAFAFDIRERFDIPRTSAWRMIQRLQRYEVVDERKIGGQSLISIKDKYRRNL
jgi:uncharacterized membrane protein